MADIIAWSGGMDSTLCLFDMAIQNPKKMITAMTVTGIGFGKYQRKAEALARKRIKQELKKRKINNIQYCDVKVDSNFRTEGHQMKLWLSYVAPSMDDKDNLLMSYLSSDGADFFAEKNKMEKAFKALMRFRGIKADLSFPYQYWTKGGVIKELKKNKLIKLVSYCGDPKKDLKPCGKCMKCMSVKRWTKFGDKGKPT